ncbi:MAG: hydroxyneurosporene dehydrogenase [Bacilli bacterium]|nr:hydroxyneurosporene dehydrogenase [Bacilli bacterium]
MKKILNSIHPDDELHYKKMGLTKDVVEIWEDGARTDGSKGTYEWWYNDFHFPDGTIMVIIFFSKSPIAVDGPIVPQATLELTLPDGTKYSDFVEAKIEESHFSTNQCDVKVGESSLVGDLKHYEVTFVGKQIQAHATLDGTIPAWRSQSGSIFFGDKEEHYFAWLPSIPEGKAVADVTFNGQTLHLQGSGYHDHNWGNISMLKLMHHWYWGRAKIGDYKVISAWITAEKKYGYKEFDVFMLSKNNKIIGDNSNHTLKFLSKDEYIDEVTGKPVFNKVIYEYLTPDNELYRITYDRKGDISKQKFIDLLPPFIKLCAKLIGFSGSYLRFEGEAIVEKIENNEVVEKTVETSAVWELMYFGKSGADKNK